MSDTHYTPEQLNALLQKEMNNFIALRTRREMSHNEWYKKFLTCDEQQVLSKIPFDYKHMSYRELVPEAYEEFPNQEILNQQIAEANEKCAIINGIINDIVVQANLDYQRYMSIPQ